MVDFIKKYKIEITIFFVSFIVGLAFFLLMLFRFGPAGFLLEGDTSEYLTLAKNLIEFKTFSLSKTQPLVLDAWRTPLYPAVVAFFYFFTKSVVPVIFFQLIIAALTVVFVYKIGLKVFSQKIALIAALVFSVEPNWVYLSSCLLTETLFIFLFIVSIYYFINFLIEKRQLHLFFSGIFLGLATLTRPAAELAIIIFIPFIFFIRLKDKKKIIFAILILLISFYAVLSPWIVRNKINFGINQVSWLGIYNLLFYNAAGLIAVQKDISVYDAKQLIYDEIRKEKDPNFNTETAKYASNQSYIFGKAMAIIGSDVPTYAKLHLFTLVPFFFDSGLLHISRLLDLPIETVNRCNFTRLLSQGNFSAVLKCLFTFDATNVIVWSGLLVWLAIYSIVLFGIYRCLLKDKQKIIFLVFFILVIMYFASVTGLVSQARYRVPVEPFIFLLFGYGLVNLLDKIKASKTNK